VAILKGDAAFEFVPVTRFAVDPQTGEIAETRLVEGFDYGAPAKFSHIKETVGFGNYVPLAKDR